MFTTDRSPLPVAADAMITSPTTHTAAATIDEIQAFFHDDHVHAALIVDGGVLLTVIDRSDLPARERDDTPAASLGALDGRTVEISTPLALARQLLLDQRRRRLAVVDPQGMLRGLLCLKRTGLGFCTDWNVNARRAAKNARDILRET